ncbi:A24 family peptidase [Janthinobacterium aquaticum]|uniref:A24 family peptidase n=1 Tax=Janthinobacterium sp. FT58W TaxID=2654254 RepID=UPI00126501A4|nr:prepilin peptidase [Janthinobacterium sp. FT58W]KAB8040165.1 prepilin peptidase [Janthinobacterium sp. FT58W]
MTSAVLADLLLLLFVALAAASDLARRKIPNRLVLAGIVVALGLHGWQAPGNAAPLLFWLGGMAAGFFLFLPLYLLRGMAAGDVKLIAMAGAFAGPWATVQIALATFVLGGLMALLIIGWQGQWRACARNLRRLLAAAGGPQASVGNMPYGLAIALGSVVVQGRHYL